MKLTGTFNDYKFLLVSEAKGKKSRGAKNARSWTEKMENLIKQNGGEVSETLCEGMTIIIESKAQSVNLLKDLIKQNKITT